MSTPTYMTLDDVLTKEDRYDVNKVLFFAMTDDKTLVVKDTNLFTIYMRYLQQYVVTYKISKALRQYYRFRPDLFSTDLYGTPNLSWLILSLNGQECASKFRLKSTVRIIPAKFLANAYDTIVTKSSDKLSANWNEFLLNVDGTDNPAP